MKHMKWILIILLAVLIVSFVFTIGNFSPLGGQGGQRYKEQPFFGYDLSSARDQQEIYGRGQASLSLIFPSYFGPPSEEMVQNYSLSRVGFLYIADQIGLPKPTKAEFKEFVQTLSAFQNFGTQEFDQTRFSSYVDSLAATGQSEAYVTSIIEQDYRMNKVREILQGPGNILPFEAVQGAQLRSTEWTLETAKLPYTEFEAEIIPTQEELENYFQNNVFRYEVAAKTKASYLIFDPSKYLDSAYEPEAGEKSIHFFTNKARYQAAIPAPDPVEKEDGTTETPEAPEVTLEEVEEQVIAEIRQDRAVKETQKIAEEFAYSLFDQEIKNGSPEFAAAIADAGLTIKELVPYPESAVIMQEGLTTQTLSQVFRLNESRYFSSPIENSNQYVILIHQGEEPAYTPELSEVLANVTSDLTDERKRALFIEKGAEFNTKIVAALESGESFEEAAKSQGLTHKAFEAFKRTDPSPEGFDQNLLGQLDNLETGDVSEWIASATDGTIIYAAKKVAPTFDAESEEVKTFLETQNQGRSNVELVMGELMNREISKTGLVQDNS